MTFQHDGEALQPPLFTTPTVSVAGMGGAARFLQHLLGRLTLGKLLIETPSGQRFEHSAPLPGPQAVLVLHRWRALRQLLFGGDVGFAEAYIDGDWSSPDPAALIELAARNAASLDPAIVAAAPARWWSKLRHYLRRNTRQGSRRNIIAHYDLGNRFYEAWLDRGMTYSSALYTRGDEALEEAQTAKQDRAIGMLGLKGGEHVLEIGIGWGGVAERLVTEHGCKVTGLTLSPAQLAHARNRLRGRGKADLRLQDYRDVRGTFDAIISIEMLEAVGEAYWPTYFDTLRLCLAPGGCAVLQVITIAEDRFAGYRRSPDFIQRHVFPGGMLPTPAIVREQVAAAGLVLEEATTFGDSYARTLGEWHRRFLLAWPQIKAMGFDERFQRLWRYYLAYCEAGFRSGAIDVALYRLRQPAA